MPPTKKNQPAANDALEGAKLESRGKPAADPSEGAIVPPAPASAPRVASPAPASTAKKYRVKARTTVSHYGQMLVLAADDILSADSYGDDGLKRLLESVPHEEVS